MPRVLIVTSQVKAFFKERGLKTSPSTLKALNKEMQKICLSAGDKALADRLKIVKESHVGP